MKKVLIVDDDRVICELLVHFLKGYGYNVSSAHDGYEGLDKIKKILPDIVVMDVNMPNMNGWQLLEIVRSAPSTAYIPVIMCTEESRFKDIEKADSFGASAYVVKPITPEKVLDKIKSVLKV